MIKLLNKVAIPAHSIISNYCAKKRHFNIQQRCLRTGYCAEQLWHLNRILRDKLHKKNKLIFRGPGS